MLDRLGGATLSNGFFAQLRVRVSGAIAWARGRLWRRIDRYRQKFKTRLWAPGLVSAPLAAPSRGRPHGLPGELIVSLTSYPPRFRTLDLTLRCLLTQTVRPDRVILWIAEADMAKLPPAVVALVEYGLDIRACKDTRSYKKIIPALAAFLLHTSPPPTTMSITPRGGSGNWWNWPARRNRGLPPRACRPPRRRGTDPALHGVGVCRRRAAAGALFPTGVGGIPVRAVFRCLRRYSTKNCSRGSAPMATTSGSGGWAGVRAASTARHGRSGKSCGGRARRSKDYFRPTSSAQAMMSRSGTWSLISGFRAAWDHEGQRSAVDRPRISS